MHPFAPFDLEHEDRADTVVDEHDLRVTLTLPEGRRFLFRVLESCGVFRTSFTPDPLQTAFREGQRNVGLSILAEIMTVAPDRYQQMLAEQQTTEPEATPHV